MNTKFVALLFALLFLAGLGQGQFYVLDSHAIEINVDSAGNAQVSERYFLLFQNELQLIDFRETVNEIGVSLDGWRSYDSRIYPRIGQEKDISVQGIEFIEEPSSLDFLQITYSLNEPLMEKKRETSRVIEYGLKAKYFNEFGEGPLWVIPQGTSIIVRLPKGVEIKSFVKPDATIEENTVVWDGYVSGNELFLEYNSFKQIASFDLNQAIRELMQSDLFWILVAIVAIVSVALLAKRKAIASRIEGYVLEHSDFDSDEED